MEHFARSDTMSLRHSCVALEAKYRERLTLRDDAAIQIAICFLGLNAAVVATAAPLTIDPNLTALIQAMQSATVLNTDSR